MKIDARTVPRVLDDVGAWRVLFLHGDDVGLIRERAQAAVKQVVGEVDNPFRLARLEGEDQNRLEEEALALSLAGGRRVVWVRGVQDQVAVQLERVLAQESDALIIMEGSGLGVRSRIRLLAEKHPKIAFIGCYPEEGRALSRTITDILAQDGIRIEHDALAWLRGHLGSDRILVRGELEKLRLYAEPQGRLTLDDVRHCVGDSGSTSLEDAVYAALTGDRTLADQALERALADGANAIAFARVVLNILERLQYVVLAVESGKSRLEAMNVLRPPVFFRRKESFMRALERWPGSALAFMALETQALEFSCKQSGVPDILLCQRHLARLCHVRHP